MPVTIRPYTAADADATIEVFVRAIRETASANYTPPQVEAWATVDRDGWSKARLARPTWLAMIDGQAAGFTDLEPDGHLDMMYVHPAFQRRGVARALLRAVEGAARAQNLDRLYSEVSLTARPFFEAHGFRILKEERVLHRGETFRRYRMEKPL